jgi:hypothetical protein
LKRKRKKIEIVLLQVFLLPPGMYNRRLYFMTVLVKPLHIFVVAALCV